MELQYGCFNVKIETVLVPRNSVYSKTNRTYSKIMLSFIKLLCV